MSAPLLALGAASCYSMSQVAVRLGTRRMAPSTGMLSSLYAGSAVLGLVLMLRGVERPSLPAVLLFMLAGMLAPGVARLASITSVARIGATRTVPIISAFYPLLSVVIGAVLLAERLTVLRLVGIALMLAGILLAVRATRPSGSRDETAAARRLSFLLLPFVAGAAYGVADFVRKQALGLFADPLAGAFIGITISAVIWSLIFRIRGDRPLAGRWGDREILWFVASGVCSAAAQVLLFRALLDGDLAVVSPIVSMQPVIVALLVRLFLNRIEPVGLAVGMAAVFAAGGTALLAQ